MNVTGACMLLTICLTLLTQNVFSTPIGAFVQDMDARLNNHLKVGSDRISIRDRREVAEMAQPGMMARQEEAAATDGGQLSRLRRQVASMAASTRRNSNRRVIGRGAGRSRLTGRQRYHRQRAARVHNW